MKTYFVYIITNKRNGVLYTGITNDIERRNYEHKHKINCGFASKYNCNKLVYYEDTNDISSAIDREKQTKGWLRSKEIVLIESLNPAWKDLSDGWFE